ncbi:10473_t:CDS:2 [Diversispora eburnea]|uniref:10473_t:CDS:1 n=1 Tax=Diversispora eburnea TaxID=1213867 RepID=A0A9N8VLS6_9GLOM|nr:10473_t:CDS:2 [Diversispora eburnea]
MENQDSKKISTLEEEHTSAQEAIKAEEEARKERTKDKQAEKHAHQEANLFKQEMQNLERDKTNK